MKCLNCGAELPEGAVVCEACGAAVDNVVTAVEGAATAVENVAGAPKKSKKGLVIGLISAAVVIAAALVIVFCFVLKGNGKAKGLAGSYSGTDSWGFKQVYVFDNGTYVWYDEEISIDNVFEVGSYELKDDSTIVCYSISGDSYEYDMKYDEKEDAIIFNEEHLVMNDVGTVSTYKSDDKKATLDVSVSGDYISVFEDKICNAVEATASQCSDYEGSYIDIDYDSLNEPEDEFYEILAKELNFKNDKTLQFMLQTETIDGIRISVDDVSQLSFFHY